MRPYYSEFVRHCLRYYIKTLEDGHGGHPVFGSDAERENWKACYHATKNMSPKNLEIIKEIYRPGDTIPDKIYNLSNALKVPQVDISHMIGKLEREVAKRRGLI